MSLKRDPICGMNGAIELDGYGFCSQHCVEIYGKQKTGSTEPACCATPAKRAAWRDPLILVIISGVFLLALGTLWPAAAGISVRYAGYLRTMGLPILAGLIIGGWIDYAIPKSYIIKLLARPRKRVILLSTALGFLASTCSHGCLALAVELYRKGASTASVISFLLASPWASLSLTFILLSLFGASGAVIIVCALLVAMTTGLIFQHLAKRGWVETNPHTAALPEGFSIRRDVRQRLSSRKWSAPQLAQDLRGTWEGMMPLARMVLGWLQLGLILSAVIGAVVPHQVFLRWLGPTPGGLALTLAAATAIEVCSEGSAPIAFELYRHTGALGNAFAFLMAGVVTDFTELGALWTIVGRRTVFWLLIVSLPLVLVLAAVLNGWVGL